MSASIDSRIVTNLNSWGSSHASIVRISSEDFVYIAVLVTGLWFVARILSTHAINNGASAFLRALVSKGVIILGIPIGMTILVSELISKFYVKQRPFVSLSNVQLLVLHSSDGGMPSHHVAFMAALVACVYFYDRRATTVLAILTLTSAVARVAAGLHFPSDILAGVALGLFIVYLYRWVIARLFSPDLLRL